MKKTIYKICITFFALIAFINLCGCSVDNGSSQISGVTGDPVTIVGSDSEGLEFSLDSSGAGYKLTGLGTCTDNVLIIPSMYLGRPVVSIGQSVFPDSNNITQILIPNTIKSIVIESFNNCYNLVNIEVAPGNQYYKSIAGNLYSGKGTCLFQYAIGKKDEYFAVPNFVERIYTYAFAGCQSLKRVDFTNKLGDIGSYAFYECGSLETVDIPDGVFEIGSCAFAKCYNLKEFTVSEKNKNYLAIDGHLYSFKGRCLVQYALNAESDTFYMSKDIVRIEEMAFLGANNLSNVYYNGTIEDWCNIFFYNYMSNPMYSAEHFFIKDSNEQFYELTNLQLQDLDVRIGAYQFYGFDCLEHLEILDGITKVPSFAFAECINLEEIIISDNVLSFGDCVFLGCNSVESITIPFVGENADYTENLNFGYLFGSYKAYDNTKLVPASLKEVIITSTAKIGESAFSNCNNIESIILPDSLNYLGAYAFGNLSNLNTTIYDNAKYLGSKENPYLVLFSSLNNDTSSCVIHPQTKIIYECAFFDDSKLSSIVIPEGVIFIGEAAFESCMFLEEVTLPKSIQIIGECAFSTCMRMNTLYYNGTIDDWNNIKFGEYAFDYNLNDIYMKDENGQYYKVSNE